MDPGDVARLFGLPRVELTHVGRGAVGHIWRLDAGPDRYALKVLTREPDPDDVRAEVRFTTHLAACGMTLPTGVPAPDGQFVVRLDDHWLRLYQWVDGAHPDLSDPAVPERLGTTLGLMHAHALPAEGDPLRWYQCPPDADAWAPLAARAAHTSWGRRLADATGALAELATFTGPAPTDGLVTCHRDFHPDNAHLVPSGNLVPLDWDDVGPETRDRELARVLLDWHHLDGTIHTDRVRRTITAYRTAGGTGTLSDERAFGMVIAADQNFLRNQAEKALAPTTSPADRTHAEAEIHESLDRLPTPTALAALVTATH